MRSRLRFYLDYYIQQLFQNKIRFILAFLSFSVASVILLVGFILIDSFYYSQFDQYKFFEESSVIQYNLSEEINDQEMMELTQLLGNNYTSFTKKMTGSFKWDFYVEDSDISVSFSLYGTSSFDANVILTESSILPSTLIKGRGINNQDISLREKVIVIDDITEELLFGGNGLDQYVKIPIMDQVYENGIYIYKQVDSVSFRVIGVYDSNQETKKSFAQSLNNESEMMYNSIYYIPSTINLVNLSYDEYVYVFWNIDSISSNEAKATQILYNYGSSTSVTQYFSFNSIVTSLKHNLNQLRVNLIVVMMIILFISSLIIIEGQLFSIKERIQEIGIKQAVGATKANIVEEIVFEGLIIGLISFIVGFILSIFIVLITLNIIVYSGEYGIIEVHLNFFTILLCALLILLTCLLSSIFPSIYVSKIKIVDSLRFE